MRKTFFVVALSLVCVGVSGAADVRVERVDSAAVAGACPCGHSLVCVGPKGGRYCVNSRGQKKYM